jgi:hypothetical protein
VVQQVATDEGVHARLAMAEGWLLAAEIEVMMAEVEACIQGPSASGWKPSGKREVYEPEPGEEIPEDLAYDLTVGWTASVPVYAGSPGDNDKTYLASYWHGQPEKVAASIASQNLLQVIKLEGRFLSLADNALRETLWTQERRLEHELYRRGAMAVANLGHALESTNNSQMLGFLDMMRLMFPGSPLQPTQEFVQNLELKSPSDPTPDHRFEWHMGCMIGATMGPPDRTLVLITDNYGQYEGYILASKIFQGQSDIPSPVL